MDPRGLTTDEQPSPYQVVAEHRVYRLRHYYTDSAGEDGDDSGGENREGQAHPPSRRKGRKERA